jgi:hypothetical protein
MFLFYGEISQFGELFFSKHKKPYEKFVLLKDFSPCFEFKKLN